MELVDVYGTQIEGIAFGQSADFWDNILEEGKVYLLSNGNIKLANKRFSTVKNDFFIVFEKDAQIVQVAHDDGNIPC